MGPSFSRHQSRQIVALVQVTPVLGRIVSKHELRPNPAEVDAVFDVPLSTFLSADPSLYSFRDTTKSFGSEVNYRLHFFQCGEFCVWGLTASILIEAAKLALGKTPDFQTTPAGREYSEIMYDEDTDRVIYRQEPSSL